MLTFLCFLAGIGIAFVLGVVFAQSVKDWLKGIPSAVRAEVSKLEADAIATAKRKLGV